MKSRADVDQYIAATDETSQAVDQLSDDLRNAAHRLHPSALEHFGVVAAIESHCSDFMNLQGIQVKLTHRGVPTSIPMEVALCLYRITQECLNNVAKRSQGGGRGYR